MRIALPGVLTLIAGLCPWTLQAQPLGAFTWQLQPFCNRVTVTVFQSGGSYTLDGFDDQCGGDARAPLAGVATVNPNGSIQLGFAIVVNNGLPVHLTAQVSLPGASGTWRDSLGHSGDFVLAAAAPGSPRPLPNGSVPNRSIGAAQIIDTEVQRRVAAVCPTGQLMTGVNIDGTVTCDTGTSGAGDITAVVAGAGLSGGGTAGDVTVQIGTGAITGAMIANAAVGAAQANPAQVQQRVAASCSAGSSIRAVNQDGTVTCETTSGDITAVVAGAGLTGGAAAGDATLALNFAGNGVAPTAARSDHYVRGTNNTAIGTSALNAVAADRNTAIGRFSLEGLTTGSANTAVGDLAVRGSPSGSDNSALGASTLIDLISGSNNVAIGSGAGGVVESGSNNIYIQADATVPAESNTLRMGSAITRAFVAGVRGVQTGANDAITVVIDSAGQLGTLSSSRRAKNNIADLGGLSRSIFNLRPVQFTYKQPFSTGTTPVQYGLIAEEVALVMPELVAHSKDGEIETVKYHLLPTLLLAEVQRLERERATMAREKDALAARMMALERTVAELAAKQRQ